MVEYNGQFPNLARIWIFFSFVFDIFYQFHIFISIHVLINLRSLLVLMFSISYFTSLQIVLFQFSTKKATRKLYQKS